LRTFAGYRTARRDVRVISIDIEPERAASQLDGADPNWRETIHLLEGDVRDSSLPARVAELVPGDARCFVVEDTEHTYETTKAALEGFARFVPPSGFFVVEDGCVDMKRMSVDAMRLGSKGIGPLRRKRYPEGVLPALNEWLVSEVGRDFMQRRDLESYGLTCHPCGFLQRRGD
jgi:cephalosporin hydroxylase